MGSLESPRTMQSGENNTTQGWRNKKRLDSIVKSDEKT
jgi:hypothetical protein